MTNYSTEEEIWKDVIGYEGYYKASNLGRVKSLDRISNSNGGEFIKKEKMLKPSVNKGYLQVHLWGDSIKEVKKIHRIVAIAFIENNENKPQINHKDGNKENNHVNNLEWCSNSENQKHAYANGLKDAKFSSKRVKQYSKDGEYIRIFESARSAGREMNTDHSMISRVCNGKQKTAKGYIWEYE